MSADADADADSDAADADANIEVCSGILFVVLYIITTGLEYVLYSLINIILCCIKIVKADQGILSMLAFKR